MKFKLWRIIYQIRFTALSFKSALIYWSWLINQDVDIKEVNQRRYREEFYRHLNGGKFQ